MLNFIRIEQYLNTNGFNLFYWSNILIKKIVLHLHEIVEGLYFHFSLSVCVCLCLCVCPTLLVNKIPAERMHRFGHVFR